MIPFPEKGHPCRASAWRAADALRPRQRHWEDFPAMNFISTFFKEILDFIFRLTGNYGWSVIIFTLLIRMLLLPLDLKSRKSMRAMSRLQPKLNELQRKYGNDKEKLTKKTQELYKQEGVSMFSGCLPMLIQLPILWFMFAAMRVTANEHTVRMLVDWAASVEAGVDYHPALQGWLWIKNVFQPDSFSSTVLPAFKSTLAGITAVDGSSVLTAENIQIAKDFLSSDAYRSICIDWGSGNFLNIPMNFIIMRFTFRIPTSITALLHDANGLFILPVLAAVSQLFMTKVTGQTAPQGDQAQQNKPVAQGQNSNDPNAQMNPMNSGMMKWFFPIFSLYICATSNAAFALYWMTVNVLAIVQNIAINKYFDYKDKQAELNAPTEAGK